MAKRRSRSEQPLDIQELEMLACEPHPVDRNGFNPRAMLPYGLTTEHIYKAMNEFLDFLAFLNRQLTTRHLPRLECFMMPANFSSLVSEFMVMTIPKYHSGLVKNQYHNGHPDLLPAGMFPNNAVQYSHEGIEVKASRYNSGWQGHNPENSWLIVFVFDSNRPRDRAKPKPFKFLAVYGAKLSKEDWKFSGRSETSRRTITASVTESGRQKMVANWIYRATT